MPAKRSVGRKRGATVFDDIVDCDQSAVIVVTESARLVINNLMEMRHPVGYGQNLIDLLLILRGDKLYIGVSEDIGKLVSHRIRIDRNRNRAQRLGCHHGPVELRPIGTDDGDRVSWLQSKSLQARGISTHDLGDLGPGPSLPDAKILMPKRRTATKLRGVSQKQPGERVKRSAIGHVGLHPKTGTLVRACLWWPAPFRQQPCELRILPFTIQGIESPTSSSLADPDAADWVFHEKVGSRRVFVANWPLRMDGRIVATQSLYVRVGSIASILACPQDVRLEGISEMPVRC